MANRTFSILLHAGTTESWIADPGSQKSAEQALFDIAREAGSRLASGARSVDIVEHVVSYLEDCPLFNAGKGAVLNNKGKHELEAGIVDGSTGAYGAVTCVDSIKNPIKAARLVMDTQPHCFLTGAAAIEVASRHGIDIVPNSYFTTATRSAHWKAYAGRLNEPGPDLETVGAVALDIQGNLAAAGSTGGLTYKMPGRIGDTAIAGAGLFADQDVAIVCSGNGDDILRHSVASKVRSLYQQMPLGNAVRQATTDKALTHPSACAILALDRSGQCSVQSSGRTFLHASSTSSGSTTACEGTTIPLLPQLVFYKDHLLSAGFTRYPVADGHVVLAGHFHAVSKLMSLKLQRFVEFMSTARHISKYMNGRIGLACDGGSNLSLIPLVGTSGDWKPCIHKEEEFHPSFPGFLTTKNGPKLSDSELTATQAKVLDSTFLKEPHDYSFSGDASDQNLFARLVRGKDGTLARKANLLNRFLNPSTRLTAPRSWSRPKSHSLEAAKSPWYTAMSAIQSSFIPVILECDMDENARRMMSERRINEVAEGKGMLLDTELLAEMRGRGEIYRFGCAEAMVVDVSRLTVEEAADMIAMHVKKIMGT
ncbi:MAG: hypothetical protein Q9208_000985 [Pyrenodesmia sp. 3 TL-2023]